MEASGPFVCCSQDLTGGWSLDRLRSVRRRLFSGVWAFPRRRVLLVEALTTCCCRLHLRFDRCCFSLGRILRGEEVLGLMVDLVLAREVHRPLVGRRSPTRIRLRWARSDHLSGPSSVGSLCVCLRAAHPVSNGERCS